MISAIEEYSFKLENFEGPLDLLLHLISKAKIEPKDIFVSEITEQYIGYMHGLENMDMERASDFLQMAATLVYIKSRSLLPMRNVEEDLDEDGLTPEEQLIQRLNEYKRYKDACETLKSFKEAAEKYFYKFPEQLILADQEITFSNCSVDLLFSAYVKLLKNRSHKKADQPLSVDIYYDKFSVKKQTRLILARLQIKSEISFFDLLTKHSAKEEIAVTLMALLELIHMGKIHIVQNKFFDDIFIRNVSGG